MSLENRLEKILEARRAGLDNAKTAEHAGLKTKDLLFIEDMIISEINRYTTTTFSENICADPSLAEDIFDWYGKYDTGKNTDKSKKFFNAIRMMKNQSRSIEYLIGKLQIGKEKIKYYAELAGYELIIHHLTFTPIKPVEKKKQQKRKYIPGRRRLNQKDEKKREKVLRLYNLPLIPADISYIVDLQESFVYGIIAEEEERRGKRRPDYSSTQPPWNRRSWMLKAIDSGMNPTEIGRRMNITSDEVFELAGRRREFELFLIKAYTIAHPERDIRNAY